MWCGVGSTPTVRYTVSEARCSLFNRVRMALSCIATDARDGCLKCFSLLALFHVRPSPRDCTFASLPLKFCRFSLSWLLMFHHSLAKVLPDWPRTYGVKRFPFSLVYNLDEEMRKFMSISASLYATTPKHLHLKHVHEQFLFVSIERLKQTPCALCRGAPARISTDVKRTSHRLGLIFLWVGARLSRDHQHMWLCLTATFWCLLK